MIARLMNLVAPKVNRVGPYTFFAPQLLVAAGLLVLYDVALWMTDKDLLNRPHQARASLPYLLLDYFVFFEVTGWIGTFGQYPWALLIGPRGRVLCLIAFVTTGLWLLLWIMMTINPE